MFLRLENIAPRLLVGKHRRMSFAADTTPVLWRSFMPERHLIPNRLSQDLFSLQVFDPEISYLQYSPDTPYEKWALAEVSTLDSIPEGMEAFRLAGGLYAVFLHQGPPAAFARTFDYIFKTWLPASSYELDNREHFEILGEKYRNNDPSSEEEVYIPVRPA